MARRTKTTTMSTWRTERERGRAHHFCYDEIGCRWAGLEVTMLLVSVW